MDNNDSVSQREAKTLDVDPPAEAGQEVVSEVRQQAETQGTETPPLRLPDICERAGITYRQADYWVHQGFLSCASDTTGTGVPRNFSYEDLRVAIVLGRLSRWGVATLHNKAPLIGEALDRHSGQGWLVLREEDYEWIPVRGDYVPSLHEDSFLSIAVESIDQLKGKENGRTS